MGVPEGPFHPLATRSGIRVSPSPARDWLYLGGGGLPHSRANSKPAPRSDALPAGKVTCTVGGFTALPAPPCGALLHGVHVFWIRV